MYLSLSLAFLSFSHTIPRLHFAHFHFPITAYSDNQTKPNDQIAPKPHIPYLLIPNETFLTMRARSSILRWLENLLHSLNVSNSFVKHSLHCRANSGTIVLSPHLPECVHQFAIDLLELLNRTAASLRREGVQELVDELLVYDDLFLRRIL